MKKQNKFMEFLNSKGFYTALFTCLFAVLAIAAFVSIKNIDAISKLSTYGEKDLSYGDQLQPAGIQQEKPISELSKDSGNSGDVRKAAPAENKDAKDGATGTSGAAKQEVKQQPDTDNMAAPQIKQQPEDKAGASPKKDAQTEGAAGVESEQAAQAASEDVTVKKLDADESKPEEKPKAEAAPESKPADKGEEKPAASAFEPFNEGDAMSWPLDGAIVMEFSMEHAIYDKTLDQYRTNPTISISSDVGTQVKAAADGVVKSITIDPRTGYTVVLEHGNGWQSVYGQLQETILVKEGQTVTKGQAVGGVGSPTKYGVLDGSHLVFGINRDGVPQNPSVVLIDAASAP